MIDNNIAALITLVEDPNEEIYSLVSRNLIEKGVAVIPDLEKAWENSMDEKTQNKLETLIQEIQFNDVYQSLNKWHTTGAIDLMYGAWLVSKYQYPDLDFAIILSELERIRKKIWLELNNNLTALEKVKIINHIIYEVHKFSPNLKNFYSPQNSYINQVLESKKGNSLTLSILYSSIAKSLGMPVMGVNLPKNFILAYMDEYSLSNDKVLFYINPFNKGAVLGEREIDYFLKQQKLESKNEFYYPCSNSDIILRLILSLVNSYQKLGYTEKIKNLQKLAKIFT